jgi:hypothetical protein
MTGKPKKFQLWQEIVLAVMLKVIVLTVIWFAWFAAPENQAVDATKLSSRLFSQSHQEHP